MKNISKIIVCTTCLIVATHANATPLRTSYPVSQSSTLLENVNVTEASISSAEKFIGNVADKGIAFLSDSSLSQDQRKAAFKKLLKSNFDMKTIARFALGRYWRSATKAQQKEYMGLFEKMILNVYASRFNEYSGEKLTVNGARAEGKKDILVHTLVQPKSGPAIKVDWRVRNKKGKSKIIDIIVEGVSMSLTQRADFSSVVQRGGGDIEVLLEHLRNQ